MIRGASPKVSIGLPVFNGERYLAETIQSILAQTFSDFELIISDNASTDRTEDICRSFAAVDGRIRYVRNKHNIGAVGNYNNVQRLARGAYFRWANYDDLIAPNMVARCVEVLDNEPTVILAYTKSQLIDQDGVVLSTYTDRLNLRFCRPSDRFIHLVTHFGLGNALYGLIRGKALETIKNRATHVAWDNVFLAELSLYGRFWEIPEILFSRRMHPGAFSQARSPERVSLWYDGRTRTRVSMRTWRLLLRYFTSTLRAPIETTEKARILAFLLRWSIWGRHKLVRELGDGVREIFARR